MALVAWLSAVIVVVAAAVVVDIGVSIGKVAEGQRDRRYPAATSASASEGPRNKVKSSHR